MKTNNYLRKWLATLFLMLAAVSANAYDAYVDGIYYNLNSDTKQAEVTSGDSEYNGSVVIPETVTYDGKTYNVTSIGEWAFYNQELPSVTIGNNVTSIGTEAFVYCYNLESITIPKRVTSIGAGAFDGCYDLTSITIPKGVTNIGDLAFDGCNSLTSITIPECIKYIEYGTFSGCNGLTSINVEAGNTYYDSRNACNAIIETASNTLIIGCINTVIPNGVATIGNSAFARCRLTSIILPNSLISIGVNAFYECI